MTKLLKHAMAMMDELPENSQNTAARQIMRYVEELSEFDESPSSRASPGGGARARSSLQSEDEFRSIL